MSVRHLTVLVGVFAGFFGGEAAYALNCGSGAKPIYYAAAKKVCYKIKSQCKCSSANLGDNDIAPGMPGYNKHELDNKIGNYILDLAA